MRKKLEQIPIIDGTKTHCIIVVNQHSEKSERLTTLSDIVCNRAVVPNQYRKDILTLAVKIILIKVVHISALRMAKRIDSLFIFQSKKDAKKSISVKSLEREIHKIRGELKKNRK